MRNFVISLTRAVSRRTAVQKEFERTGLEFEFFQAVDGKGKGDPRAPFDISERVCRYGKVRSRTEMACFASHYLLWQQCVDLGEPIAVFEDDIVLSAGISDALARAENRVENDWIRLFGLISRPALVLRDDEDGFRLIQFVKPPAGTQAYVISPAGAQRLIERTHPIRDPVDDYMDRFWDHGVRCLGLLPWQVDVADAGSDVEQPPHDLQGLKKVKFRVLSQYDSYRRRNWLRRHAPMANPTLTVAETRSASRFLGSKAEV